MTRLLRLVALVAYLFGGYLIGFMIGRLVLIPVFAVAHVDKTLESVITIAGGVVGALQKILEIASHAGSFITGFQRTSRFGSLRLWMKAKYATITRNVLE